MPEPEKKSRYESRLIDGTYFVIDTQTGQPVSRVVGDVAEEIEPEDKISPRIPDDSPLIRSGFEDTLWGMVYGAGQGVVNTARFVASPLQELGIVGERVVYTDTGPQTMSIPEAREYQEREQQSVRDPRVGLEPFTTAGKITEGTARFGVGLVGAGKATAPIKALQALRMGNAARRVAYEMIRGAMADTVVSSPYEGRLSDVLVELDMPMVSSMASLLETDTDDSVFMDRLKTVVEGAVLGVIADTFMNATGGLYRKLRASKKAAEAGHIKEAQEAIKEGVDEYRAKMDDEGDVLAVHEAMGELEPDWTVAAMTGRASPPPMTQVINEGMTTGSAAAAKRGVDGLLPNRIPDADVVARVGAGQRLVTDGTAEKAIQVINVLRAGVDGDDVAKNTIRAVADDVGEIKASFGLGGKIKLADVEKSAGEILGENTAREMVAKLRSNRLSLEEIETATAFLSNLVRTQGERIKMMRNELVPLVRNRSITHKERAAFAVEVGRYEELMGLLSGVRTGASRVMNASRIQARIHQNPDIVKAIFSNGDEVDDALVIAKIGGDEDIDRLITDVDYDRTAEEITGSLKERKATVLDNIIAYRMNSLLSGPRTQLVNFFSGLSQTIFLPSTRIVGSLAKGDVKSARKSFAQIIGLYHAFKDSLRMGLESFKANEAILKPGFKLEGTITDYSFDDPNVLRKLGATIGVVGRTMQATDEFIQQIVFRSRMYAELLDESTEIAARSGREEADRWISESIEKATQDPARFLGMDLESGRAMADAELATFRGGVGEKISRWVSKAANSHPMARVFFHMTATFVTTPINIVARTYEHIPIIPLIHADMRKAISGARGADESARMLGAQVLGAGLAVITAALYANGRITGAAPEDPDERDAWYGTGRQPYSIRVGDTWYSYQRLEPFGMLLGLFVGAAESADTANEESAVAGASVAWRAFTQNITDKTFFKGLSDIVMALDDPERFFPSYSEQLIGSFIPFSSFARQTSDAMNNRIYRNVQFGDTLRRMSFGVFSPDVMKLDLKGKPIEPGIDNALLPITGTPFIDDPVETEIAASAKGLNLGLRKKLHGVDLTPEQMHRLQVLQRTMRNSGGRTMYDELERLIETDSFQQLEPVSSFGEGFERESPRAQALQKRIDAFRDMAVQKLYQEYPDFRDKVLSRKQAIGAARSDRPQLIQQFLESSGVQ